MVNFLYYVIVFVSWLWVVGYLHENEWHFLSILYFIVGIVPSAYIAIFVLSIFGLEPHFPFDYEERCMRVSDGYACWW